MHENQGKIDVFLEVAQKKTFAVAIDWPGWARSEPDEPSALRALHDYGGRYAAVLRTTALPLTAPDSFAAFNRFERQPGNSTTVFGAPAIPMSCDSNPVSQSDLQRFQAILHAS
jgi:hypothetical protein